MSESERKQKIQSIEREMFILDMKDHWDSADYSYMEQLKKELNELKGDHND